MTSVSPSLVTREVTAGLAGTDISATVTSPTTQDLPVPGVSPRPSPSLSIPYIVLYHVSLYLLKVYLSISENNVVFYKF